MLAGLTHDGDDLFDAGRISRIAKPFVARRAPCVLTGHRRRRPAPIGGIDIER